MSLLVSTASLLLFSFGCFRALCYERCIFDLDDYQKAIDRSRCKLHHPQAPIIRPLYSQFITRQEWKGIFLNVAWIVLSVLIVLGVILNYQADRRKA